ncbi:MAG: DivIVA domain-containing protein [Culicoidibacterales bacterium]
MKLNFTENDIYEAEFKTSFRGYDKNEVDEFLDKIMEDYITLQEMIEELQAGGMNQVQNFAVEQERVEQPAPVEPQEDYSFELIRPKAKNVTAEVPPLSSLFNFEVEDEGEDVEELLNVSNRKSSEMENTNYDLIQRLAQLEKEVASLRKGQR